jgi:hypothetical protein
MKYPTSGTSLMPEPTDLKATAIFEQWASSEYANLDPLTSGLVVEKFFKK